MTPHRGIALAVAGVSIAIWGLSFGAFGSFGGLIGVPITSAGVLVSLYAATTIVE